jgi:nitrite reductase (NO-forming)
MVGPSLAGVLGRKSGSETGFNYSDAMRHADITWSQDTLAAYLSDPQKVVPGNRMPFPGLKSEHDRADIIAFLGAEGGGASAATLPAGSPASAPPAGGPPPTPAVSHNMPDMPDVTYTLRTGIAAGRMMFLGVGGKIDGQVNPLLTAVEGQNVQVTLINGEGAAHDIAFPDQDRKSPRVTGKGASTTIAFHATKAGDFTYFCTAPGHRQAGMEFSWPRRFAWASASTAA